MGRNKDLESGNWFNPYNGKDLTFKGAWYGDEPSEASHRCAHAWTTNDKEKIMKSWYSANCADRDSCAICQMDAKRKITLHGLCQEEYQERVFDDDYYINGQKNGKVHFQGFLASHIYLDDLGQWRLESYSDRTKYAYISAKVKQQISQVQMSSLLMFLYRIPWTRIPWAD